MHFQASIGDFLNLLSYEILQDRDGFTILAIDSELTAASILVQRD